MDSLSEIRLRLLSLHKALVEAERIRYEKLHGRQTAQQFLAALVSDPALAWLRPMSALIVELDELLDAKDAAPGGELTASFDQLRGLLVANEAGNEFQQRYAQLVETSPDVAYAHAVAVRALQRD